MFEYTLVLRYPNGRAFHLHEKSDHPLGLGHQFDAFGHRWKIEREIRPKDLRSLNHTPAQLQTFACEPLPTMTA